MKQLKTHLFNKYLSRSYYVPDAILGAKVIARSKIDKNPTSVGLIGGDTYAYTYLVKDTE